MITMSQTKSANYKYINLLSMNDVSTNGEWGKVA